MGNPFSRKKMDNFSDDEILDVCNPNLFIQTNRKPIKIHLEGFDAVELLKLIKIVENNGGEVASDAGRDVIIISPPGYVPETGGTRFNVDWLYQSISANVVQSLLKYRLKPHLACKVKADPEAQKENEMPVLEGYERQHQIYRVASSRTASAIMLKSPKKPKIEPNVLAICSRSTNENSSEDEEPPSIRRKREQKSSRQTTAKSEEKGEKFEKKREKKCNEGTPPKHMCNCCGYGRVAKKRRAPRSGQFYTHLEKKAMIDFLIENNAIKKAGGCLIWEKMVRKEKSDRSPTALQRYFNTCLRYRVHRYTDDEQALAAFKERERKLELRHFQTLD